MKLIKLFIFVFYLLVSFCSTAKTYPYNYPFKQFTTEDGLPSSEIYDAIQDDKGFMWFATDRGLARFDGYEFETFTTEDGLPDNVVFHLRKDHLGRIWFACFSGEIGFWDGQKIILYPYNKEIKKQLQTPIIVSFELHTKRKEIYIGTSKSGLLVLNEHGVIRHDTISTYPFNLKQCGKESVFYKNGSNFYPKVSWMKYENDTGETEFHSFPNEINYKYQITAVSDKLPDGSVFISCGQQLFQFNGTKLLKISVFDFPIHNLYVSKNKKKLWVSEVNQGVYVYNLSKGMKKYQQLFPGHDVSSVYEDREGGTWVTSTKKGVSYIPNHHHYSISKTTQSKDLFVYFMIRWKNFLIISDGHTSIYFLSLNEENGRSIELQREFKGRVRRVFSWGNDTYAETDSSLFLIKRKENRTITVSLCDPFIKNTICAINDTLLILRKFEKQHFKYQLWNSHTKKIQPLDQIPPLPYQDQNSFTHINDSGDIYRYSRLGIDFLYSHQKKQFIYDELGNTHHFFDTRTVDMANYPNLDFLAATRGEGLLFVKNKKPFALKKQHGLLSNQLTSLAVDSSQRIWVGSSKGLNIIDSNFNIINLRTEEGLISNEITDIVITKTRAYVGTKKGLSVLDIASIQKEEFDIPVYIKSVKTSTGKEFIPKDNQLAIAYNEPYVRFDFVGISYKSIGRIKYRYRLNRDEPWQHTSSTSLLFSELQPGEYQLEIQASNGENGWSKVPAFMTILVPAPFWLTLPFYLIIIVFISLLVFLGMRSSIQRIQKRENLKRQIQDLRYASLNAQMNPHFMFNSLNSIQHFIMQNDRKASVRYLAKFAKLMRKTLDHSQEKNITLQQEIEALNLYLTLEKLRFDDQFDYEIDIEPTIDSAKVILPALLTQPIVENAILHGVRPLNRKGIIRIQIRHTGKNLHIEISDNGVGINAEKRTYKGDGHQSKGAQMTKERVFLFAKENNALGICQTIDRSIFNKNGTSVIIFIPYTQKHN